jgi:gallate decarboxylase subunit C
MNADEVLWALITRTDLKNNIMLTPKAKVSGMLAEGDSAGTAQKICFDATASFKFRDRYARGQFHQVRLDEWLSPADVARVQGSQSDYLKSMLARGL